MTINTKKEIVIFGFKDAMVGQFLEMFKIEEKYKIKYFLSINPFSDLDIDNEHKIRPNSKTEFIIKNKIFKKPVFYCKNFIPKLIKDNIKQVFVLEDKSEDRLKIIELLNKSNIEVLSLIHETSFLGGQNLIEPGTIIFPMCFIGYKTDIKMGVIIQQNVSIGHHNVISKCCNIDPNVTTNGFTFIGKLSTIHSSATVINKIRVGEKCIIGAGALVVNDCLPQSMYIGTPARKIKDLSK